MAQSAHAATAVLHLNVHLPEVKEYLADWMNMRKTVLEVGHPQPSTFSRAEFQR